MNLQELASLMWTEYKGGNIKLAYNIIQTVKFVSLIPFTSLCLWHIMTWRTETYVCDGNTECWNTLSFFSADTLQSKFYTFWCALNQTKNINFGIHTVIYSIFRSLSGFFKSYTHCPTLDTYQTYWIMFLSQHLSVIGWLHKFSWLFCWDSWIFWFVWSSVSFLCEFIWNCTN